LTVSENADWKQKYRDSLLEMEAEEERWRQLEQALRRLVGRLCAAGMGLDPQLDDELAALAAANRRNADVAELEKLAASLTNRVVAVDALSPVSTTVMIAPRLIRWDATRAAVTGLLERLKTNDAAAAVIQELSAELAKADSDAALAAILRRVADLIHERCESLAQDRQQTAAVLSEVTKRLDEMAAYLRASDDASRARIEDTQSLNDDVVLQVRELSEEVHSATDLGLLQTLVTTRLESVAKQVCDFRAREEIRVLEHTGRAEHMRARIADLERETLELHSKLDRERDVARLDTLTGLANRKSFDERFAHEVAHRSHDGTPVIVLLWDIDDFKAINDGCGHRAGDRVLQNVARCFTAAVRDNDFVARIGGEEFVLLLKGLTLEDALRIANQVRTAVEALKFHFRGTPVRITVSCGITELREQDSAEAAFDRADAALYRAKHGGKNLCIAA
jgi:diguanylate cyclase